MTTRSEAQRLGLTQYQGKPCRHGHSGLRWTASRTCVECQRDSNRTHKWHQIGEARVRLSGHIIIIQAPRHMALSIQPLREETPK